MSSARRTARTSPATNRAEQRPVPRAEIEQLSGAADAASLPCASGPRATRGVIRREPGDFRVTESLPFTPAGHGEHVYLRVCKTGQNTRWVAAKLAECAGIALRSVGYAGLKDRHSVSEQWFSLHLPGRDGPVMGVEDIEGVEILERTRHSIKLRTGMLAGNRFGIVVRSLCGDVAALETRLASVSVRGAPNYFGPQRFGRERGNLRLLFEGAPQRGREARSHGLSALRSALFNGYLATRVCDDTWHEPLAGEIIYLPSEQRYRHASVPATESAWPTGLLWGCGSNRSTDVARALEDAYFARFPQVTARLAETGVRMMRRPLVLQAKNLRWTMDASNLTLEFSLGRGAFATSILSELLDVTDATAATADG